MLIFISKDRHAGLGEAHKVFLTKAQTPYKQFETYRNVYRKKIPMDTVRLAKILKALSHPKRLELYFNIAKQDSADFKTGCECGCFVSEMILRLKLGAPTISHHLKELENAGLITTERNGKFLSTKIKQDTLKDVTALFADQMLK